MNNIVLVGKVSGKIVTPKEKTKEYPNLENMWRCTGDSSISYLFPTKEVFVSLIKTIVESKIASLEKIAAFSSIADEFCDFESESEAEMYDAIESDEFGEFILNNWKELLKIDSEE